MHDTVERIALPIIIAAAGFLVAGALVATRKAPPRSQKPYPGPLVEGTTVHTAALPITVRGDGTVRAKTRVQLIPQVAGRVVEVHPAMTAGGFFRAGEPLVVIEPADFELAEQRANATVRRAEVALEQARAEADVARREWDRIHPGEEPASPLVLKIPQVEQAEAELEAARADLAAARLNLDRTRLSLPFDGRVVTKSADVGQYVGPGQPVATVYGSHVVEIPVPLRDSELHWFDVPGPGQKSSRGAAAEVWADFAGGRHRWRGRVVRTQGEVDAATRMVHVIVEVHEPFSAGKPALIPGMFVHVVIQGRTLDDAFTIPRYAVHDGGLVWTVVEGHLRFTPVTVARFDEDRALLSGGLHDGDVVVTSQLEVVSDGMKVRVAPDPEATGDARDAAGPEPGGGEHTPEQAS